MTFWVLAWKWVLVVALVVFAVMALCVSIGGIFDIRQLFCRLAEDQGDGSRPDGQEG